MPLLQKTGPFLAGVVVALAAGCWPSDDGSGESGAAAEPVDDLPGSIPEPAAGVRVIELAEQIIEPGSEVQLCHFLEPEAGDSYAKSLKAYQGKFGHHLVLFHSVAPEPAGTVRDCTSVADMVNLVPVISTVNFGLDSFAEGMALRIPAGTQMVVQQHYVNTGEDPIRVRDLLHLESTPKEQVKTLAGFYGVTQVDFSLAPDEAIEQEVTFSCEVPADMNVFVMSPHMHEWGVRIWTRHVKAVDDSSTELLRVDPWQASFRDGPPNTNWPVEAPLVLKKGDRIETTCVYKNTAGKPLEFPSEMCATAGYFFPAPEGSEAWTCDGS